jgi:hypothetical protein
VLAIIALVILFGNSLHRSYAAGPDFQVQSLSAVCCAGDGTTFTLSYTGPSPVNLAWGYSLECGSFDVKGPGTAFWHHPTPELCTSQQHYGTVTVVVSDSTGSVTCVDPAGSPSIVIPGSQCIYSAEVFAGQLPQAVTTRLGASTSASTSTSTRTNSAVGENPGPSLTPIDYLVAAVIIAILAGLALWRLLFHRKPPCTKEEIAAETTECENEYQKEEVNVRMLEQMAKSGQKDAEKFNQEVAAYTKELEKFQADLDAFNAEANQYEDSVRPPGPPHPGNATWNAWYKRLVGERGALVSRLAALTSEYEDRLKDLYEEYDSNLEWYKKALKNLIDRLVLFLKRIWKCIRRCEKVEDLLRRARGLPKGWKLDKPKAPPTDKDIKPVNPPPPVPPEIPPPPKGGGGGQTEEKKKCTCKLEHKEDLKQPEIILAMTLADFFSMEDSNTSFDYKDWNFDPFNCGLSDGAALEGIPLRGYVVRWDTIDVKASGGELSGSRNLRLVVPLAGAECQWSLDEATITDSSDAAKGKKLNLDLIGPAGQRGKTVNGSCVILALEHDPLYVEWFKTDPVPHFEGKLLDFQARLTFTAKIGTNILTKKATVTGRAKKKAVETSELNMKSKLDAYDFDLDVRPANNWEDFTTMFSLHPPNWNRPGTGMDQVLIRNNIMFEPGAELAGCILNSRWSGISLDMTAPESTIKMKENETRIIPIKVKSSATLEFWTTGHCENDRFQIENLPVDYALSIFVKESNNPSPSDEPRGVSSGGYYANGQDPVFKAPQVDEETNLELTISASFTDFEGKETKKEARVHVTVTPFKDMRTWFSDSRLLDKLAQMGAIRPEDKEKMQYQLASEPGLWDYSDMGLKVYGLYLKSYFGTSNVSDRFKSVAKDCIYTYEISSKFPNADFTVLGTQVNLGTPDFAPVPKELFNKLHPLKRVIEPLVGTQRLGDLLVESTGKDYFFRGGSYATFETAWQKYFKNVYKDTPQSDWTVPDEEAVAEMVKNVRFGRLREAAAVRVNEIIKMTVAADRGLDYKPKVPIQGTPKVVLSEFKNPKTGVTKPELNFVWTEQTKIGEPQRFKITMEVETDIVGGVTKVKQTGKFINFVMELSEEQRISNNTKLANMQVPEAANYGKGPSKPPTPAKGSPATVDELFDMKQTQLAMQSWKNWALDTGFRRATGSAVHAALVYTFTNAYTDLILETRKNGLGSGVAKFGLGILQASGSSFLKQGLLDFSTRVASLTAEALRVQEERYLMAFGRQLAKQYAKGAARDAEIALAEKLVQAGRIPFAAGRWTLTRAVPIIGWAVLLYDIAKMTDSLSRSIGEMIFGPDRTPEQEAWLNPLYTTTQDEVGEYIVVRRGMQLRATDVIDDELTQMSQKRGVSKVIDMPEGATIYKTLFDSRATKFIFKGGTELELADEVIGPGTEWLPSHIRSRLPDLLPVRYMGQTPDPRDRQAYSIAQNKWWFFLANEKTGGVVYKADQATLDKLSNNFASGSWSSLDPVDVAYAFSLWGAWRESVATKWVRLKSGDSNNPYTLTWWRDYNGKECKVLEHGGQTIIEPRLNFNELLGDVSPK